MARPIKQGLDYYPLDVGFLQDVKIRRIMRACGIQSIPVLISLLANIYRNDGYFLRWSPDMSFLIADELGVSEGAVTATVDKAVQVDFFNANMYECYGVLTSMGIQSRFFEAASRRMEVRYDARFLLINVNVYKNLVNVDNNPVNVDNNQQSKGKESKGKEKKIYSPSLPSVAEDIVSHLNSVTGSSYRSTTSKTRKLIAARLAEGFTVDDFKTVITKKAEEWTGTDMAQYLRPETLFGTKFEGYLNQPERNNSRSNLSRAEQERREGINAVNRLMAEYEEEARGQNE